MRNAGWRSFWLEIGRSGVQLAATFLIFFTATLALSVVQAFMD